MINTVLFLVPAAVIFFVTAGYSQTYTTAFPATENPISESGVWTNGGDAGLDWQNVETTGGSPGTAYSTGICEGYNDCIAILSGYPADQGAQATVFREPGYTPPSTHEVELLLRFKISAHNARGYEMDFWFGGSTLQIVRWNGAIGDFTPLSTTGPGPNGLVTGDVVKARMVGNTITVYKNGNLIATCIDATWSDGNPGMGFFVRPGGTLKNFCFSNYTATGISGTGVVQENEFRGADHAQKISDILKSAGGTTAYYTICGRQVNVSNANSMQRAGIPAMIIDSWGHHLVRY